MPKYLASLTVTISPHFSKKSKIYKNQPVTVKSKDLWYPATIAINKKLKVDKVLLENGCIPESLDKQVFEVESGCPWLFAKAVTFSCEKVHERMSLPFSQDKKHPLDDKVMEAFSFSDFSSITSFLHFLKLELVQNSPLSIRIGMKICFEYLTQTFLLTVKDIVPSFYETPQNALYQKVAFRCFEGTQISIDEEKVRQKLTRGLDFKRFGGYEPQIEDLKNIIDKLFDGTKKNSNGVLISGMPGTGKSLIGAILHSVYKEKCSLLSSEEIIGSFMNEAELTLKLQFQKAHARAPSIIFIDNIDEICSSRDHDVHTAGTVNALLYLMDGIHSGKSKDVLVIATATEPKSLDQALRRPGRLSHDITLSVPSERERLKILQCLLQKVSSLSCNEECLSAIASKTSGFVAADLRDLITESFSHANDEEIPSFLHFEAALAVITPSSLKNVATGSRKVLLEDFIGYEPQKSALLTAVELSLHRRELFLNAGITTPSRMLLFGPTGCGKSTLVHGLATHFNLALIPVRRSNVFGKYFGESEKNLGQLFDRAQASSPCILHFESFDGLAGKKQKNAEVSTDVEDRVINHLKVLLDGVVGYENILVIAETNRPDLLDKDVIRHGRFHKYVYLDLPSCEDRLCVFKKQLHMCASFLQLSSDIRTRTVDDLVARTEGYTVTEVLLICREIKASLEDKETSAMDSNEGVASSLWTSAIEEALESISPRTSAKMMRQYSSFASLYCQKHH